MVNTAEKFIRFSTIYLDFDGLIADFHTAALAVHGKPEWTRNTWPREQLGSDLMKILDIPTTPEGFEQFWDPIRATPGFFSSLKMFYWVPDLIRLCEKCTGPHGIKILTGPASGTEEEVKAKMHLLAEWGLNFEVIVDKEKGKYSKAGRLLIDDWEKQVDSFNEGEGLGVLVPQPWNRLHRYRDEPLYQIRQFLLHKTQER